MAKIKLPFCFLLLFISTNSFCQDNVITLTYDATAVNVVDKLTKTTLDPAVTALNPKIAITVKVINADQSVKVEASFNGTPRTVTPVSGSTTDFTIAALSVAEVASYQSYNILVTGGTDRETYTNVAKPPVIQPPPTGGITAHNYLLNNFDPSTDNFHDLRTLVRTGKRYEPVQDEVYIILDERGKLIGNLPVNVDEDDVFYIYMVINESDINNYDLEVIGEYSPTDLQIRSYQNIAEGVAVQGLLPRESWTVIRFERGPFTSDNATFTIKKLEGATSSTLSSYTLKINNLYHVGVGVSLVNSQLGNPTYDLAPLPDGTGNTIITLNNNPRTFLTFNVIWYWSVFQNPAGSTITKGRDILKDEPAFTIRRIFPTVGVSIDGKFRDNFFGGFVYEFARGGSIVAGGHYGKIQVLAEPNFVQGESVFTGTKNDIRLTDRYLLKFFFGVNVDTRIINTLFGRGRAANQP